MLYLVKVKGMTSQNWNVYKKLQQRLLLIIMTKVR